jgi:uncharacterized repeat protein (TIGR03803 family)
MTDTVQRRGWISGIRWGSANATLTLAVVLVLGAVTTHSARAQTETVLYSFNGIPDGRDPRGGLVLDAQGNLYGTTVAGGTTNSGIVFKVTSAGEETVLHSFVHPGGDGYDCVAGLVRDKNGNLYGTTHAGGASLSGTVFKVTPAGTETLIYSFTGGADGSTPEAGLLQDAQGNLYGTTSGGGAHHFGTVFKVTQAGVEKVLHSFAGGKDGAGPYAGLVRDKKGNFYCTTAGGGANGAGTVFKMTPTGTVTVLHSFQLGRKDGWWPKAGLVLDASGNLYSTTFEGGAFGKGTVFEVTPTGTHKILYSFGRDPDGNQVYAGLVTDGQGNLYGTTSAGGTSGSGTIFKVTPSGKETILYSFKGTDGRAPYAALVRDVQGNFYGTTSGGGAHGFGTVFKLTP